MKKFNFQKKNNEKKNEQVVNVLHYVCKTEKQEIS